MLTWLLYRFVTHRERSIHVNGKGMRLEISSSAAQQMLGLMHRKAMRGDRGMLFVFGRESRWGIWMMGMRFPIDIVWLDGGGKVITIVRNAPPCSSLLECETYKPSRPSRYVLELASGGAARYGIKEGAVLRQIAGM